MAVMIVPAVTADLSDMKTASGDASAYPKAISHLKWMDYSLIFTQCN